MGSLDYLLAALTPLNLLLALGGVVAGTVIGALPGLTATMAVAVLVPFTFTLAPAAALIALGAIYTGAIYGGAYGGAYAAILLNTPGTPSSIATTFDGYPMARKGDGDLALTLACLASVLGGLVGAGFLLLLAPPMATVALKFGPVEYFWLGLFGLTLIASLGEGSTIKGLIGGGLGTVVGILPGAGGSIASLVAYSEAKRSSPRREHFGKGEPDGVLATESANNATVGSGFIPTLVLGIPGTPPDAIILGALLVQGIRTGPTLFTAQAPIVYIFIWGLILATLIMLPVCLLIGRFAFRSILSIPKSVLVPSVTLLTVLGSFAVHNNVHEVQQMVVLGVLAWGFTLGPLGFLPSCAAAMAALLLIAHHGSWALRTALLYGLSTAAVLSLMYALFKIALQVPLP